MFTPVLMMIMISAQSYEAASQEAMVAHLLECLLLKVEMDLVCVCVRVCVCVCVCAFGCIEAQQAREAFEWAERDKVLAPFVSRRRGDCE